MNRQLRYEHGETGIVLMIIADVNKSGNIELKKVFHKGEDILPLLGEDITVDIEMYCDDFICSTEEQ